MTDPIADMLTRIRNAQMTKKNFVIVPFSKFKLKIAQILEKEGWVGKVETASMGKFEEIKISLLYLSDRTPRIKSIKRISKPGSRVYVEKDGIPTVLNNFGIAVLSTSRGLMTNKEAKRVGTGGEIVCEIY
jgi:small subunit ribosomal protein S8